MTQINNSQPTFLVGVARSGTSFFQRIINLHPNAQLSYEGKLALEGEHYYNKLPSTPSNEALYTLLDQLADLEAHEEQNEWLRNNITNHKAAIIQRYKENPSYQTLIEALYQTPNKTHAWGNKMLRAEMCADCLKLWPNAKFILLQRDPRSVYLSQSKRFNTRLDYSTVYWNTHTRWVQKQIEENKDQFLVVNYEDLVLKPRETLTETFTFLGIYDEAVIDAILEKHPPFTKSLNKWKTDLTPSQLYKIESLCFDGMTAFNYEPLYAKTGKRMHPLRKLGATALEYRGKIEWNIDWWRRKKIFSRLQQLLTNGN